MMWPRGYAVRVKRKRNETKAEERKENAVGYGPSSHASVVTQSVDNKNEIPSPSEQKSKGSLLIVSFSLGCPDQAVAPAPLAVERHSNRPRYDSLGHA
jgi:hypothetical protein